MTNNIIETIKSSIDSSLLNLDKAPATSMLLSAIASGITYAANTNLDSSNTIVSLSDRISNLESDYKNILTNGLSAIGFGEATSLTIPTNLKVTSDSIYGESGSPVTVLKMTWDNNNAGLNNFSKYIIKVRQVIIDSVKEYSSDTNSFTLSAESNIRYSVSIAAEDIYFRRTKFCTEQSIYSIKDIYPPTIPFNITAGGFTGFVRIEWSHGAEKDLAYFDVYRNSIDDFSTSTRAGSTVRDFLGTYSIFDDDPGDYNTWYYWVRAIDNAGNVSDPSDSIQAAKYKINSTNIQDLSIWANTIADSAITRDKILAGAVSDLQLANSAVTNAKIAVGAINTNVIANSAITSTTIANNAITTPKIAANAVTANNILAGTITAAQIAANTIYANNIAASTISGDKIVGNTITGDKIAAFTITANNISTNTITANNILANTITSLQIQTGAITALSLSANCVGANNIISGAVTADKIQAGVITADKLNVSNLSSINQNTGNLSVTGTFKTVNGSPVQSGSSMTGYGAVINQDGTFALGSSTTNIAYNGSTLNLNGQIVNTEHIINNAVTYSVGGSGVGPVATSAYYIMGSGWIPSSYSGDMWTFIMRGYVDGACYIYLQLRQYNPSNWGQMTGAWNIGTFTVYDPGTYGYNPVINVADTYGAGYPYYAYIIATPYTSSFDPWHYGVSLSILQTKK